PRAHAQAGRDRSFRLAPRPALPTPPPTEARAGASSRSSVLRPTYRVPRGAPDEPDRAVGRALRESAPPDAPPARGTSAPPSGGPRARPRAADRGRAIRRASSSLSGALRRARDREARRPPRLSRRPAPRSRGAAST